MIDLEEFQLSKFTKRGEEILNDVHREGEDIKIGAGITTQNAASYIWNGLEIIDTPRIDTKIRPDHDEITYEQINYAALLIFVITSAGFSERLGNHFRKLAID